ncbi:MAG: sensor histidine kinase [Oscillospiraceae bacterium]|nr:sensor histidine kinase [Oscillospiraceae bacterium]
MLDIILNGRLGTAVDEGIRVEIPHITVPSELPLSDPDLCALIMNIVDNAIAATSKGESPYIMLKIHEKHGQLGITCENSFDPQLKEAEAKKETVPKHGLGLKIVRGIVAKYKGAIIEERTNDHFIVKIAIPLL